MERIILLRTVLFCISFFHLSLGADLYQLKDCETSYENLAGYLSCLQCNLGFSRFYDAAQGNYKCRSLSVCTSDCDFCTANLAGYLSCRKCNVGFNRFYDGCTYKCAAQAPSLLSSLANKILVAWEAKPETQKEAKDTEVQDQASAKDAADAKIATQEQVKQLKQEVERAKASSNEASEAKTACEAGLEAKLKLQKEASDIVVQQLRQEKEKMDKQLKQELERAKASSNEASKAKTACEVGLEAKLKLQKEASDIVIQQLRQEKEKLDKQLKQELERAKASSNEASNSNEVIVKSIGTLLTTIVVLFASSFFFFFFGKWSAKKHLDRIIESLEAHAHSLSKQLADKDEKLRHHAEQRLGEKNREVKAGRPDDSKLNKLSLAIEEANAMGIDTSEAQTLLSEKKKAPTHFASVDLPVTKLKSRSSEEVARIPKGTGLVLLEDTEVFDDSRMRCRIASPEGWISVWMADMSAEFVQALGSYITVHSQLLVSASEDCKSAEVTRLDRGTKIELLEFAKDPVENRVRAKIANGWISIQLTDGTAKFAVPVEVLSHQLAHAERTLVQAEGARIFRESLANTHPDLFYDVENVREMNVPAGLRAKYEEFAANLPLGLSVNEKKRRYVFHTSKPAAMATIESKGMRPSHCPVCLGSIVGSCDDKGWFGDHTQGIYVSKHADYTFYYQADRNPQPNDRGEVMIFEMVTGRVRQFSEREPGVAPSPGFECHEAPHHLEFYVWDQGTQQRPGLETCRLLPKYVVSWKAVQNDRVSIIHAGR